MCDDNSCINLDNNNECNDGDPCTIRDRCHLGFCVGDTVRDCPNADGDDDGDGVPNKSDLCPGTPVCALIDFDGCPFDADMDNVFDGCDNCPDNPDKAEPGVCGCDLSDDDFDHDGIVNCLDGCPENPFKIEPGDCGCGQPDTPFCGCFPICGCGIFQAAGLSILGLFYVRFMHDRKINRINTFVR